MSKNKTEHYLRTKYHLDKILALILFPVTLPLFILIGLAIKLDDGGPVFFTQKRPGLHGNPFNIYKFRTMTDGNDSEGTLLPDSERLTPLGKLLRRTSLDELPELFNVLKGEMSLVGPRPLLMRYLDRYTAEQARRHEVKPGITGWAQVNGRNAITWEEKFRLDVWYVDNQSFWLDLKIIILTIWKIFKQESISQPGRATMDYFLGTSSKQAKKRFYNDTKKKEND